MKKTTTKKTKATSTRKSVKTTKKLNATKPLKYIKKVLTKKTNVAKAAPAQATVAPQGVKVKAVESQHNTRSWSASIYFYWFIILFFIAATFYILGRSHVVNQAKNVGLTAPGITEETLLRASDYFAKGKANVLAGNLDDAIADLTAAVEANNTMVDGYILRGEAYMQSGDLSKAMEDFNHALEIDPRSSVAYYDRSLLNTRLEDYNAALMDINNTLAAYVSSPNEVLQMRDLYAKRGQLNLWLKNWEGAIADYKNSLARPEGTVNPNVYAERAEAYTALGSFAEAVEDYASAIRVITEQIQGATTPEQREDLSGRAMSYFEKSAALKLNLGDSAGSRTDLEAAYAIASSLGDSDTMERLQKLLDEMQ